MYGVKKKIQHVTIALSSAALLSTGITVAASGSAAALDENSEVPAQVEQRAVEKYLDAIQRYAVDGEVFYPERAVAAGVPREYVNYFAGAWDSVGGTYVSSETDRSSIDGISRYLTRSANHPSTAESLVAPASIWDRVLRVAGSYVECQALRLAIQWRYPFAVCVPNPTGNGTWLVLIRP